MKDYQYDILTLKHKESIYNLFVRGEIWKLSYLLFLAPSLHLHLWICADIQYIAWWWHCKTWVFSVSDLLWYFFLSLYFISDLFILKYFTLCRVSFPLEMGGKPVPYLSISWSFSLFRHKDLSKLCPKTLHEQQEGLVDSFCLSKRQRTRIDFWWLEWLFFNLACIIYCILFYDFCETKYNFKVKGSIHSSMQNMQITVIPSLITMP